MLFLHPALLAGLALVAVPVVIHWWNRRNPRTVSWAASHFLHQTVRRRTNRTQFEDALLLGCRCTLIAVVVCAVARPFTVPGAQFPWTLVLPASLLAAASLGVAFAFHGKKWPRWFFLFLAVALAGGAIFASATESKFQWSRFGNASGSNVVLILDNSASTQRAVPEADGTTVFNQLLGEAREIVSQAPEETRFTVMAASGVITPPEPFTAEREKIDSALRKISPVIGSINGPKLLAQAHSHLDTQPDGGRIIFVSDGQSSNWNEFDEVHSETPPPLILHHPPAPKNSRNLSIQSLKISRETIGTDRPVGITAIIANTGTESITPGTTHFFVDGNRVNSDRSTDQLRPGESAEIRIEHQFQSTGARTITVEVETDDDLTADDVRSRAFLVRGGIKVLIIEGNNAPRPLDRAGVFVQLALTPDSNSVTKLAETTTVAVENSGLIDDFSEFEVVVIAAAPRLPSSVQEQLTNFVSNGGGLLVIHDARSSPEFYNEWRAIPDSIVTWNESTARIDLNSGIIPALPKSTDPQKSDLDQATVRGYWKLSEEQADEAALTFSNGDPFLLLREFGNGNVAQLVTALDDRISSLAKRDAFVPFVHELTSFLANPTSSRIHFEGNHDPLTLRFPVRSNSSQTGTDDDAIYRVLSPDGSLLSAQITSPQMSPVATIENATVAGIYRMDVPADTPRFRDLADEESRFPFSVALPPEESDFATLDESDLQRLNRYFPTMESTSIDSVLDALGGQVRCKELGPLLIAMALILVVLEITLTSWITRSRRVAE